LFIFGEWLFVVIQTGELSLAVAGIGVYVSVNSAGGHAMFFEWIENKTVTMSKCHCETSFYGRGHWFEFTGRSFGKSNL
jgi:hypothetical protein